MEDILLTMTRRGFLKGAAICAMASGLPAMAGCAGATRYRPDGAAAGKALVLANARIIDVAAGALSPLSTLVCRDGRIESIGDRIPELQQGDRVVDLMRAYVLPGLIDAHCHATLPGQSSLSASDLLITLRQIERNFVQQIRQGVTTIRDMGALPEVLHDRLRAISQGDLIGPRVVYCNAFTNVEGGHPDIDPAKVSILGALAEPFIGRSSVWFKNTQELVWAMTENLRRGASFIKLTMDRISVLCGKGGIPAYTDEHLRIIADFAQRHHLPVAGHVHTRFGFDRAVGWGLSSIEHSLSGVILTDKDAETMARKSVACVPTLVIGQMLSAPEAFEALPQKYRTEFIENELEIRRRYIYETDLNRYTQASIHRGNIAHLKNYRRYGCGGLYARGLYMADPELYFNILLAGPRNLLTMRDAGVLIGCGTDAGVPFAYHGTLWREMEMLGRCGLANAQVLRAATINNAKILGLDDRIGSIETGKAADLAVFEQNPLDTLEACRNPKLVIKDGRIYDVEKIGLSSS
ncbi:MAG TPA: amidohydrolase family protein [Smithellaceae bacterium]|nr:amidohydrolase family protein [Smithellaceae bacterium]